MSETAQATETLHFSGILTQRFQSRKPHDIVTACDNAYLTMGNYGTNWALTIQIRDPKIGDTVEARWNSVDDGASVYGRFMVRKHGNGLEIIADACSDHVINGAEMCRVVDTYGYSDNTAYYISGSRETVRPDDHAF